MGFVLNQQETQYTQPRACRPAHWASLEPDAAMAALGSRRAGLNKAEVAERLARYGHNTLPRLRRRAWYLELAANFIHLFALLLWAGAGLAWVAGMPQLAWAIIAVILINGLFSFWQEYQAERAAEALEALLPRQVTVRRDGQAQLVPTSEVAPGDLLLLSEGEATPADARLISAERLRLDVSSLTGESRPIPRTVESIGAAPDAGAATLSNMVFAGTTVASGRGEAVVFATGANTEFGRIAQLTQSQDERPSPLQRELKRVTRVVTILSLGLGIAFFVIGVNLGGLSPTAGFLFAIGIIVANVPEGLLPTLTLALALGMKRMARRRALVKRLSSVETLGATNVILTDKTGTLTENEMTARELWAGGANYQLSGAGYEPFGELTHRDGAENDPASITEMLRAAALCCDAHLVPPQNDQRRWTAIGDPTEAAILAANVRKFVTYIFASNAAEIVPFIVFILFRVPLPLTVMQILAVDLGTDLLPALALGAESPEPDAMRRPPRSRRERLLNSPALLRAYGWLGMIEASLSLSGYFFAYWLAGLRHGAPLPRSGLVYATATTMTLAGIVACQVGNAFACRSSYQASWRLGFVSNRLLLMGIAAEVALLLLLVYAPPLQAVFGLAPLGIEHWYLLAAFGPLLLVCEEGRKALWRRFSRAERRNPQRLSSQQPI